MRKMIIIFFCIISSVAYSQSIKPLKIGDQVPDILLHRILNYKDSIARLSDFNNKLIMLDMWSVTCGTCIENFPKMQALQDKFGDKIQILLVNNYKKYEPESKIKEVLKKLSIRQGIKLTLPVPIHEELLDSLFPHTSVPHLVWIKAKKIVGITLSREATEKNITAILTGKEIKLPVKNDFGLNRNMPLLVDGNGGEATDFVYRSLFTRNNPAITTAINYLRRNKQGESIGYMLTNATLRQLILEAYSKEMGTLNSYSIIFDVTDSTKFDPRSEQLELYSYDVSIPPTNLKYEDEYFHSCLQNDLKKFFNISVFKERRMSKILVVKKGKYLPKLSEYDKPEIEFRSTSKKKYIHHYTISDIFKVFGGLKLLDQTGITHAIDMDFPENFKTFPEFLKQLGFEVLEQEAETEVYVVTNKKTNDL